MSRQFADINMDQKAKIYFDLWIKLNQLCAEGKEDSQEADNLRDIMDKPWYDMSQEEMNQVEEAIKEYNEMRLLSRRNLER